MDVYKRYLSQNVLSDASLERLGYTTSQIASIQQHEFDGVSETDLDSCRKLLVLGYSSDEVKLVWSEIGYLLASYHCEALIGDCSSAPCSAWRAERILMNDEATPRFANCVHLFEKLEKGWPGRYLGYVMLRPKVNATVNSGFRFTTVANLNPPRYFLRPRYHIISCAGGGADGLIPFNVVPFCSPGVTDDTSIRASCLHGALQAALLLMVNRFKCTPVSSVDIVTYLWEAEHKQNKSDSSLAKVAQDKTTLPDGVDFLAHTKAAGILETFAPRAEEIIDDQAKERVEAACRGAMMDYLANGIPLIMAVRAGIPDQRPEELNHAIVVFGMHVMHDPDQLTRSSTNANRTDETSIGIYQRELPDRFVTHDTTFAPFTERTAGKLLDDAWDKGNISILAVVPEGTKAGVCRVRKEAETRFRNHLAQFDSFWQDYVASVGIKLSDKDKLPTVADEPRLIVRFLTLRQMLTRYLTSDGDDGRGTELAKSGLLGEACGSYWWCVEVKLQNEFSSDNYAAGSVPPGFVYIWNASDEIDTDGVPQLELRLLRCGDPQGSKKSEYYSLIQRGGEPYECRIYRQSA